MIYVVVIILINMSNMSVCLYDLFVAGQMCGQLPAARWFLEAYGGD